MLDGELEKLLSGAATDVGERLVPVVPASVLEFFGQAHSLTVKIGYCRPAPVTSLELDDILRAARSQRPGGRVKALRGGRICLNADARRGTSWGARGR